MGGMKENLMFFGLRSPNFRLEGFCMVPAMRGKPQGKLLECEKNFPVLWMTSEKIFLFGCQPFRISQECAPSN